MALSEAAREARNKYQREQYKKDPSKRRRWNQEYWERKAAREAASKDKENE